MRRMSAPRPDQPRVIVYSFSSPYLAGEAAQDFRADMLALCAKEDLRLVEVVIDHGPPKRRPEEYPALTRVALGEADGLLIVRSPLYRRTRPADRLEKLCPAGASAWLTADELRAAGMLPQQSRDASRGRPGVKRRAAALRAAGLSLAQIGQALGSEGYQTRDGAHWSAESVAKLLGVVLLIDERVAPHP